MDNITSCLQYLVFGYAQYLPNARGQILQTLGYDDLLGNSHCGIERNSNNFTYIKTEILL